MGLLSSKSSSTTNVDESTQIYNEYDQRQTTEVYNEAEVGAGAIRADGDVTVLDGGAINGAFDFAGDTTDKSFMLAHDALNAVKDSNDNAMAELSLGYADTLGVVERLSESEGAATSKSMEKIGMMLVGGLVLVFGVTAWGKK